jgi:hypothetical protein
VSRTPRRGRGRPFGMSKLQVIYVVVGLLVILSMIIALLPPPR